MKDFWKSLQEGCRDLWQRADTRWIEIFLGLVLIAWSFAYLSPKAAAPDDLTAATLRLMPATAWFLFMLGLGLFKVFAALLNHIPLRKTVGFIAAGMWLFFWTLVMQLSFLRPGRYTLLIFAAFGLLLVLKPRRTKE